MTLSGASGQRPSGTTAVCEFWYAKPPDGVWAQLCQCWVTLCPHPEQSGSPVQLSMPGPVHAALALAGLQRTGELTLSC